MPDYDKLTDPEINRLCAERVGWRVERIDGAGLAAKKYKLIDPPGVEHCRAHTEEYCWSSAGGDYCRDRNALVELYDFALKTKRSGSIIESLFDLVCTVDPRDGSTKSELSENGFLGAWAAITATPRQHCVAFLRATEPGT